MVFKCKYVLPNVFSCYSQALQLEVKEQQAEVNGLQNMVVVVDETSSDTSKYLPKTLSKNTKVITMQF